MKKPLDYYREQFPPRPQRLSTTPLATSKGPYILETEDDLELIAEDFDRLTTDLSPS